MRWYGFDKGRPNMGGVGILLTSMARGRAKMETLTAEK